MAKTIISSFTSDLGLDKYKIDPSTQIQEYASVMVILLKDRRRLGGGLNEEAIRRELQTSFPDFKTDLLEDILRELRIAEQISEEGGLYGLTGFGFTNADYIAITSQVVAEEETKLDLTSHRFWEYIREYIKGIDHYKCKL